MVETVAANPDQTATTGSDAQLAVEKFKAAGVQSVIPLLPENAFFPYIGAENSQQYFPQLLLSDYQSTVEVALGPHPGPLRAGAQRAGGRDDRDAGRLRRQPAREPGRLRPGRALLLQHLARLPPEADRRHARATTSRSRGPIQAWCGAIRLFATAAKDAGKNLNRRTFVEAMSKITNYPGTLSPVWSFGPDKFYGPTQYQVVKIHNNVPPSSQCKMPKSGKAQEQDDESSNRYI